MNADDLALLGRLGVALAIGFLVGLERGWSQRDLPEGERVAGIRTFSLIGALGGLGSLLAPFAGHWVLALFGSGVAAFLVVAERRVMAERPERGITTPIAALLTFALGALAGYGELAPAASAGVIVALLLGIKPQLHGLLRHVSQEEVLAVLKLLVMSLVLLPLLPDQGYGPWQALNPYRLWWMVILVAGISSAGYFAMRLVGAGRGLLLTAFLGGLVSSTAVTLAYARRAKKDPAASRLLASGVMIACATLYPRLAIIVTLVEPSLLAWVGPPFGLAALLLYAGAFLFGSRGDPSAPEVKAGNPFEFWPALQFGLLLAGIMLASKALPEWLGEGGHYALAATAALSDVDAIGLNYAQLVHDGSVTPFFAMIIILLATTVNNLVKTSLAFSIGGRRLGLLVGAGLLLASLAAAALFFLFHPK